MRLRAFTGGSPTASASGPGSDGGIVSQLTNSPIMAIIVVIAAVMGYNAVSN